MATRNFNVKNGLTTGNITLDATTNTTTTSNLVATGNSFLAVSTGNVGVGTNTPGYKLEVNGSFAAITKSFVINHPTKSGMKLRYGSLEGPENGVYVRGRVTRTNQIELPDYWSKLVDKDSITVNLTPIGNTKMPSVKNIENNIIYLNKPWFSIIDCYYVVFAERADVDKLEPEI